MLITRYLEFSLPYRLILGARDAARDRSRRFAARCRELFVRLHLAGFFWGDCSLSNALFRRDAGALSAYLVDAETGELRRATVRRPAAHDLEIAEENLVGELHDLAAELGREVVEDPFDIRRETCAAAYEELWSELTARGGVRHRRRPPARGAAARLNALGFDVEEVELVSSGDEVRLLLHSKVVEPGHHRRRLLRLTGPRRAGEPGAAAPQRPDRGTGRSSSASGKTPVSDTAAAGRWLSEVFEPAIAAIPAELRGRRAAAEIFHELLEHRWFLSERAGKDVGLAETTASYSREGAAPGADEKLPLAQ